MNPPRDVSSPSYLLCVQYYNMIRKWGGWPLFQDLLSVTKSVADKHGVSIPNVGVRWVLDR